MKHFTIISKIIPLNFYKFLLIIIIGICYWSCKEIDQTVQPDKEKGDVIKSRISNTELDWLSEFQEYLYDLRNHVSRTNIYSLDEAVYGVEALINIRYANSKIGIEKSVVMSDTFTIQSNSNWYNLFETSLNNILDDLASISDTNIVVTAFDISVYTSAGANIKIITRTLFKDKTPAVVSKYNNIAPTDCDEVFSESEAYFLWVGGIESLTWFWPNLDCESECGSTDPGETGAIEEIQRHINAIYPEPVCGLGLVWQRKFTDVHMGYAHIDWADGYFQWCGISDETEYAPCDCLSTDELNCIFCTIYDEIGTSPYPITIPGGYNFINIELGVDYIGSFPLETTATKIDIVYYYGKKVCAPIIVPYEGDILTMHLEYLECC